MNLVVMQNRTAVTSSLVVAESFEKRHDSVLRDIKNLEKDVHNFVEMFFESNDPDSYGRPRKIYYMNRDGFTLLGMGYTGKEALDFKLKYINAFNQMEEHLKIPANLTAREQMNLTMKATEEAHERIDFLAEEVKEIKDNTYINRRECALINRIGKSKVISTLGGHRSKVYKEFSRKGFGSLWGEFNRYFDIASYKDLKKSDLDTAIEFIENWRPNTALQMEINAVKDQLDLFN